MLVVISFCSLHIFRKRNSHLTCGAQSEPAVPALSGAPESCVRQLSNELLREIVGAQNPLFNECSVL